MDELSPNVVGDLRGILAGDQQVITDVEELAYWGKDWTKEFEPAPGAVCFPASTEEVAEVLAYCHAKGVRVVPSGGRTGLAAGAVAPAGELVLSLARMTKVLRVDPIAMVVEVEAGATTAQVQEAAREVGAFFPLDLAAKGSSQIGGNIATNAGGLKFIRYGGMREQVLGLECVLADGRVLDCNSELRKNNTGYDLKHLMIGSEGTLGVVTKATLRLVAPPVDQGLMCLAVESCANLLKVLERCQQRGIHLTAFEFFSKNAHELVLKNFDSVRSPFGDRYPFYALVEAEDSQDGAQLATLFEELFEHGFVADGVVADSSEQFTELWNLREFITEAIAARCLVRKNDVSLPITKLDVFVQQIERLTAATPGDMEVLLFGHLGDGNIHINYVVPRDSNREAFFRQVRELEAQVLQVVGEQRGSVSAEHGIGLIKKGDLSLSRSELEIELMRGIKRYLDPKGILNPGKIFDL